MKGLRPCVNSLASITRDDPKSGVRFFAPVRSWPHQTANGQRPSPGVSARSAPVLVQRAALPFIGKDGARHERQEHPVAVLEAHGGRFAGQVVPSPRGRATPRHGPDPPQALVGSAQPPPLCQGSPEVIALSSAKVIAPNGPIRAVQKR